MSEYTDQVTRELLALTEPDGVIGGVDMGKVRQMLAEAWQVGYAAGRDDERAPSALVAAPNPFKSRRPGL